MKDIISKLKKHLDKNSIKYFLICVACGLLGTHGMTLGAGAAVTKEYCDLKFYGHWCWTDILTDAVGLGVGYLSRLIILACI